MCIFSRLGLSHLKIADARMAVFGFSLHLNDFNKS